MFGYIKPFVPDLRVREHELYKSVYCGLCRSMGKHTGCASRLTLSYDFAFLCCVRLALEKTETRVKTDRCLTSPFKVRPIMEDNPSLAYCSAVASILTKLKIEDDINDSHGKELLFARLILPSASSMAKKALKYDASLPQKEIEESLSKLSLLEKECCPSLDSVADTFGDVLSAVFSHGLSGKNKAIAAALGHSLGRIIYVLDAVDDRDKDKKTGNYNPLNLCPISEDALRCALRLELSKAEAAVNLIDFDGCKTELSEIILNTIYEGLPKTLENIFEKRKNNTVTKEGE